MRTSIVHSHSGPGSPALLTELKRNSLHPIPTQQLAETIRIVQSPTNCAEVIFVACDDSIETNTRTIASLVAQTKLPVIAYGCVEDPRHVSMYIRAGAYDCVGLGKYFSQDFESIIQRLNCRWNAEGRSEVVCFLTPGGGGASTLATNASLIMCRSNKQKCCLLDLACTLSVPALLLDLQPTHYLNNVLAHDTKTDLEMIEKAMDRHESGLDLLTCDPRLNSDIKEVVGELGRLLTMIRKAYDTIAIDLPRNAEFMPELLRADRVVLVCNSDLPGLLLGRQSLERLLATGVDAEAITVVLNKFEPKASMTRGQLLELMSHPNTAIMPADSTAAICANSGQPIALHKPNSKIGSAIQAFVRDHMTAKRKEPLNA